MKTVKVTLAMVAILLIGGLAPVNAQRGMGRMMNDSTRMGRPGAPMMQMRHMNGPQDSMFMRHQRMMRNGMGPWNNPQAFYGGRGMWNAPMHGYRQPWGGECMRPGMGRWHGMGPGMGWGPGPGFRGGMGPRQFNRPGMTGKPGQGIIDNIPNLTDKQKKDIADLRQKQMDEMKKFREDNLAKMKTMRENNRKKVMDLLTPEQKKLIEGDAGTTVPEPKKQVK